MRKMLTALVATAGLVLATGAVAQDEITIDDLTTMSQADLDSVYLNAKAGPIPDGVSRGTARFFPDSLVDSVTQELAYFIWQGKVFNAEDGHLINRVAGVRAVVAKLYHGESLFDGGEAVIVDYSRTSILFHRVRDEIRQVSPTLYLGRAYIRTWLGDFMAINFILEFDEPQIEEL